MDENTTTENPQPREDSTPLRWIHSRYASWTLALVAFAESVFAPIVIDPVMMAMILADRSRWRFFIAITVVASVVGGIVAYILGAVFFDALGARLLAWSGLGSQFSYVSEQLNQHGFLFVIIGAVTPVPYKLVAISSGLVKINPLVFLAASLIGRGGRLVLVGYLTKRFGPYAITLFRRHFNLVLVSVIVLLVMYLFVHYLTK